jgi:hypothetical protein
VKVWKACERHVAILLGGERVPVSGRARGDAPDIEHPELSIECKSRRRLPAWLEDVLRQAVAFVRDHLRELGRICLALLQDIWHDVGSDPWTILQTIEALGCRVEVLPECDNRKFVFPPAEGVA